MRLGFAPGRNSRLPATAPEIAFLDDLAKALALDPGLVAQVNATAAAVAPAAIEFEMGAGLPARGA